jgi:transposase-like protein
MSVLCKFCESRFVIKKGQAKTKFSLKQVYQCKACRKKFVETTLVNKTYPPKILSGRSVRSIGSE